MKGIILKFSAFYLKQLSIIHKGALFSQLKASTIISLSVYPAIYLTRAKEWLIGNETYLWCVIGALFLDLAIGIYVHAVKFKDFTLKDMVKGFLTKFFITAMGLGCFEIFKILFQSYNIELGDYLRLTIALIVISYPLFSAFGNLSVATDGKFPPVGWMDRLKRFQENLNVSDLTAKK